MNKYAIGQDVWIAQCGVNTKLLVCPDCCGKKYLTVIMGDDSQVTVDCTGCGHGFNGCNGKIQIYEYEATAKKVTIGGMEIRNEITYFYDCSAHGYRSVKADEVFDNEADALEAAKVQKTVHDEEERDRLHRRPKDHHGMAFNATYHRGGIKSAEKALARAQRDIEYHKAQLSRKEIVA